MAFDIDVALARLASTPSDLVLAETLAPLWQAGPY